MTRRTERMILLASLAVCVLCVLTAGIAFAAEETTGQVMGTQVNLRSAPGTDSESLAKLDVGTEVTILAESGDWYQVDVGGRQGYILADLVFVKSVSNRIAYASADGVNLRGGPSQSAYILDKIEAGHPIRVKQMVGEWYFATYEGQSGFIHRDTITLTNMSGVGGDATLLKFGMEGSEVKKLQKELARRNFLTDSQITGSYGSKTRAAVKEFQKMAKLEPADGIAGPETLKMVYDRSNGIKKVLGGKVTAADVKGRVQLIDWWKGGSNLLRRPGGVATVTDVVTGKSFKIRRSGGNKHFDVHPLTAEDTAIMRSIVGRWSWNRRAIWLTVNNKVYAASMNCMPHSPDPSKTDNFPGHFCIHLLNSRTHGGNNCDPDHQACIQYAYKKGN